MNNGSRQVTAEAHRADRKTQSPGHGIGGGMRAERWQPEVGVKAGQKACVPKSIASATKFPQPSMFGLLAMLVLVLVLAGCGSKPPGSSYRVYVTNEASGDLTIIDPVKMEALATVPLGKRARGLHPTADNKLLFVALSGSPLAPPGIDESTLPPPDKSADGIGVFDIAQNKMLRKVPGGSDPEQFAIAQDGKLLYVSNEDAAGLSFVDPANGQVLKTIPTGREPEGVTLSPDGKQIFATSEDEGTITVVDAASQSEV